MKLQRARGIVGRSASVSAMVPTPVQSPSLNASGASGIVPPLSVSQALSQTSVSIPPPPPEMVTPKEIEEDKVPEGQEGQAEGANEVKEPKEIIEIKEIDEEADRKSDEVSDIEDEPSTSAKISAALKKAWAVVKKYAAIGMKHFINWLDEDGAKKDLSDDLLIVMEPTATVDEPKTPRRMEEEAKKKKRAQRKLEHTAKYKSMIHMKPPTSSMSFILIIIININNNNNSLALG